MTRVRPHWNLMCCALLVMVGCAAPATSFGEPVVVVEDGQSTAPIVVFEDAPPKTLQAAKELAHYIEKTTGVRPELIEGKPETLPDTAIWVGYQPVLDSLFPDTDFSFEHPEEILIKANGDHLVIAGRDRWDPDHLTIEGRNYPIEGFQLEYGTVNAVYTFCQKYLDVRWLWPGELGEDIVERDTLTFEPFEYRYHPQFRLRAGLFRLSAPGDGRGEAHDWVRKQRLFLDSSGAGGSLLDLVGGHGFGDWWDRFHEEHRDYFAMQPSGVRNGAPKPRNAKLCQSNPAVWEQWIKDVEKELEKHPYKTIFNASPNDGWNKGVCVCEDCRAWDVTSEDRWAEYHPDGESLTFVWEGVAQSYVPMSDRYVTFANKLARKLKERYPDKDYYVLMHAYGASLPAPVNAVPDDNVIIAGVHSALLDYDVWTRPMVGDWHELGANYMWRPNVPQPGWRGIGSIAPLTDAAKSIRYIADNGGMGIYVDTMWESNWAVQSPLFYLMAQSIWNPDQDAQAVLDDFYRRGFGDGAEHMKAYWALIEATGEELAEGGRYPDLGWYPKIYDSAFFKAAHQHLDRAKAAVKQSDQKYARRIAFVRDGLDFIERAVEQEQLLVRLNESGWEDASAVKQAEANYQWMRDQRSRHPSIGRHSALQRHNPERYR